MTTDAAQMTGGAGTAPVLSSAPTGQGRVRTSGGDGRSVPGSVAIVGGGVAGFTTARELRARGFDGRIEIIDPEGQPYDRPPLSKHYLTGEYGADQLSLCPPAWFAEAAVSVVADRADRLLANESAVLLDSGRKVVADAVVLATGGLPRHLPVPGGDLPGLLVLRTRHDADLLRARLGAGRSLVIVGAGLIGAEVASGAVGLGVETTLVDPVPVPLVPALGAELAARLHAMHARAGIATITGTPSHIHRCGDRFRLEIDGGRDAGGRVVEAETILIAIGIDAEESLAQSAALDVDNGVLVDAEQRTSNPAVLAIGDAARTQLPGGTLLRRHEHWESAMHEAQTAAASLMGDAVPVHPAPWFWSDRHGVHVEGVGAMTGAGRTVIRVVEGVPQMAFHLGPDGRLLGAAAVDGGLGVRAARRLIDRRLPVDATRLADPAVSLRKLAR